MELQSRILILCSTGPHCGVVEVKLEAKLKYMERVQGNDLDTETKQGSR